MQGSRFTAHHESNPTDVDMVRERGETWPVDPETRAYLLHQMRESEAGRRRHFDVVAESIRGDVRGLAEVMGPAAGDGSPRR